MALSLFLFYRIVINPISISFLLFCFFVVLSSLVNGVFRFSLTPIFLNLICFFVYTYCLGNKQACSLMIYMAYFGSVLFLALFVIRYWNNLIHFDFDRLGSDFGDENDVGLFMAMGFSVSFYSFLRKKNWLTKVLFFLFACLFLYAGASTGSKLFLIISVTVGILSIFLYFGLKKWWVSLLVSCSLAAVLIVLLQLPFLGSLKERFDSFFATLFGLKNPSAASADYSTLQRFQMFQIGMDMFLRKPLLGYGSFGFANFANYNNGWSHNHFSETLCNFGILGAFFFHVGFAYALVSYFRSKEKSRLQLPFIFLVFFFLMMFGVALNSQKIYAYVFPVVLSFFKEPHVRVAYSFNLFRKEGDANGAN